MFKVGRTSQRLNLCSADLTKHIQPGKFDVKVDMERKEQNHIIIHIPPSSMCVFLFFNAYFHCECENILAVVGLLMENLSKIHQFETHFAGLVGVSQPWKEMKVHR